MVRLAGAFLLLNVSATAGVAQDDPSNAAAPAPPVEQAPPAEEPATPIVVEGERPKPVCETRRETGSIIPKRVCRTPEEVAAETERAGIIADRLQRDQDTANHTATARANR